MRETTLGAYAHQDLPFETLLDALRPARDLARSPIFQVWFNLVNVPEEDPRFGSLQASALGAEATESRFELSLYAVETEDGLRLDLLARRDLFDEWRVREFARQLVHTLEQLVEDPDRAARDLSLVTPESAATPAR